MASALQILVLVAGLVALIAILSWLAHRSYRRFLHKARIPCRMPYITSMFMPRTATDRPLPVPANSHNLGLVSQFVEIREDVVFTVEYSVRAAQMAVYQLLSIDKEIPPILHHDRSIKVNFDAVVKAFA